MFYKFNFTSFFIIWKFRAISIAYNFYSKNSISRIFYKIKLHAISRFLKMKSVFAIEILSYYSCLKKEYFGIFIEVTLAYITFQLIYLKKFSCGFCPAVLYCLNGQNDKNQFMKNNNRPPTSTFFKKLAFNVMIILFYP